MHRNVTMKKFVLFSKTKQEGKTGPDLGLVSVGGGGYKER
jgi:hypothetical protein